MAGNPTTFKQKARIKNGNTAQTDLKFADYMPVQHEDIESGVMTVNNISVAQSLCQPVAVTPNSTPSGGAYTASCSNYPDFSLSYLDKDGNSRYLIGLKVRVVFTTGITYGSVSGGTYPTLNINDSGAIPLLAQGKTMASGACSAGQTLEFTLIPYGNGVAWDADSNVRESTSDYTIYTDGYINSDDLNLFPYKTCIYFNNSSSNIHYIDEHGYIHSTNLTSDPRNFNYDNCEIYHYLLNGDYKIKVDIITGTRSGRLLSVFNESNNAILNGIGTPGVYTFSINDSSGGVKIGILMKLYDSAYRVKLFKTNGSSKFTSYSIPLATKY